MLAAGILHGQKIKKTKLNEGIITDKLAETKKFYCEKMGFGVTFENEFYLLLHTPDKSSELSFLKPNHPIQNPIFHPPFSGEGLYLTIEVENVDTAYKDLKNKGLEIAVGIKDEPWGDRHFVLVDPNGVGIDIVKYRKPED